MDGFIVLILAVLFFSVSIACVFALRVWNEISLPNAPKPRLQKVSDIRLAGIAESHRVVGIGRAVHGRIERYLPALAANNPTILPAFRLTLAKAGYRGPFAVPFFIGFTVLSAGVGFALGMSGLIIDALVSQSNLRLAWVFICTTLGLMVPYAWIAIRTRRRQREILDHFPDALDLIRICLEAGLGFDAAIQRVGHEFSEISPALFDELRTLSLELRAGAGRAQALQALAQRSDVPGVKSFVGMVLQAEKFGTGVAEAVRIHSEQLRLERKMNAEEAAAKLSTKLLFPLIFCIFPSLLLVLIGPAVITIQQQFIQPMEQTQ
jgi:tight adherence protein C